MGMNETSILAEPVKSAKERLDDLLAKVEQVKKEVQAEEEAKKVPPKIEIEVWSTIGGYLSDPHRAWYVKPFELFLQEKRGKVAGACAFVLLQVGLPASQDRLEAVLQREGHRGYHDGNLPQQEHQGHRPLLTQ